MADQVAEVKGKVDIVSVVGSRVELKRAGKNYRGLCPFHVEKTPSFFVSPELQTFKCFGCDQGGDVYSFLQEYEGMSFREALEYLADKVGVKLESYRPTEGEENRKRLLEILSLAREYYRYVLVSHQVGEEARRYLKERGVTRSLIEKFGLGWASRSWDGLYRYLVVKKKYQPEEVEKTGMVIRSGKAARYYSGTARYYDRFRGRVMFPLTDFRGRVVGFSGRLIEEGVKEAKYVNTPETDLYHKRELLYGIDLAKQAIRNKDGVIVVEGELDVISSYKVGVQNVVGVKGSALTEDQVKLLTRLTRRVSLCLDADQAGEEATKRGIEVADKLGLDVEVVLIEGGKDPDEVVRENPERWKRLVHKPVSVYEFLIERAFAKFDARTGTGKKRIGGELAGVLVKISNSVEQAFYVSEVARRLGVGEEAVEREMEKVAREGVVSNRQRVVNEEEGEETKNRRDLLEEYGWGLLLGRRGEEFRESWEKMKGLEWRNPGFSRLSEELARYLDSNGGEFEMGEYVARLPRELERLVSEVYLSEKAVGVGGEERVDEELDKVVKELEREGVKEKMEGLRGKIGELEMEGGEEEELERRQREYSELLRALGG